MYKIWPKWEESQAGRPRPGRPAYTPWSLMLIFGQSVPEHESKPNQLDLIQDIHPMVERLEPWMDGPTCSDTPAFKLETDFSKKHALVG